MAEPLVFSGLGGRIHLGVSGSVAAYKALDLLRLWTRTGLSVGATLTEAAMEFVRPLSFQALGADPLYETMYPVGEDLFGHLNPGAAPGAFVIAPATANTLAKLAHGLADEMLACQALSFSRPLVIAPAMNPRLWEAAATRANWQTLRARGHVCVEPDSGGTACGDEGRGRMAPVERLYYEGLRAALPQAWRGTRVLVTLGPTREYFDPVRFWSNPSTGTMGAALALAAWLQGAEVHALCGPVDLYLPPGVQRHDVTSARQMHEAAADLWPRMDLGLFTAAVADYSPNSYGDKKYKKTELLQVSFSRTPDILGALGPSKGPDQRVLGFAAETGDLAEQMAKKLHVKHCDLVVGNLVGRAASGFGRGDNTVEVLDRTGRSESWPALPKPVVAWRLLEWLATL